MENKFYISRPSGDGKAISLPAQITKSASKQTYYTIRLLVDRPLVQDAYRSYAYFRWVDDRLDGNAGRQQEKLAFISRQRELLEACYRHETPVDVTAEEQMLVDLVRNDHEKSSRLQFYLRNMMAVMAFDVERRGRLITQAELKRYSCLLSMAVTEALFYFIGHDCPPPSQANRYQAVHGAHIAHMLRDLREDIDLGYFNIPAETLKAEKLSLADQHSRMFRLWVLERAKLAHHCFSAGRKYIAQVKCLRFRIAAFTYLARFEWMIWAIERDGYRLRLAYPERKRLRAMFWMMGRVFRSMFKLSIPEGREMRLALPD